MKRASSELVLLDTNVLLALAWPNHQFHEAATQRLERRGQRWATCALTQLGFIRLSSNPSVVSPARTPIEAALLLAGMIRDPRHVYLNASPPPLENESLDLLHGIQGYRQVTDAYLLFVARRSGATLLTFDLRLQALAGKGDESVEVLARM